MRLLLNIKVVPRLGFRGAPPGFFPITINSQKQDSVSALHAFVAPAWPGLCACSAPTSSLSCAAKSRQLPLRDDRSSLSSVCVCPLQVTALASAKGAPFVFVGDSEGTFSVVAINSLSVQLAATSYVLRADDLVRMSPIPPT